MAYTELSRIYTHYTVLGKKLNADIKKAQGNGSYKGSQLTVEDKDGNPDAVKCAQAYLDNSYQSELKEAFERVQSGDKITVVKTKTTKLPLADYENLSDDDKKKNAIS